MTYQTICCVGDSIANGYWDARGLGWFGRLQEKIASTYPQQFGFNNLAMSGDRTIDALHRVCGEVLSREPDMLLIAVGTNDLIRLGTLDAPTDQSEGARREMWSRLLKVATHNVKRVAVVGILPVIESRYPTTGYDEHTHMWKRVSDIEAYNAMIHSLCQTAGVPWIDAVAAWRGHDIATVVVDAAHPNATGHELLAQYMFNQLTQLKWLAS